MIRLVDYSLSIILSPIIIISLDYKTLANSDSVCPSELKMKSTKLNVCLSDLYLVPVFVHFSFHLIIVGTDGTAPLLVQLISCSIGED